MLNQDDKAFIVSVVGNTINTAIQPLRERMDSLDSKVGSLDSKVGSLDSKVGSLDSKMHSLDSKVSSLQKEVEGNTISMQMVWQEVCKNTIAIDELRSLKEIVEANTEAIDRNTLTLRNEMDFFVSVQRDQGYLQKKVGKLEKAVFDLT